jgi:hypothetical protein
MKTTALSMTSSLDYSSIDEYSPISSQKSNNNNNPVHSKSGVASINPIKFPSILSNIDDKIPIIDNFDSNSISSSIFKPEFSDLMMPPPSIKSKHYGNNVEEEMKNEDISNVSFALEYDANGTFDHWIVDQGDLAPNLKVVIPEMPLNRPCLSTACIRILEGLFECRPSHRLGCRNFNVLRNHKWFNSWGYSDWQMLEDKIITPPFIPSKRILDKKLQNSNNVIGCNTDESYCSDDVDSEDDQRQKIINPLLTSDQEVQFEEFHYISDEYQPLFDSNIAKSNVGSQALSPSAAEVVSSYNNIESINKKNTLGNNNHPNSSNILINIVDPISKCEKKTSAIPINSTSNSSLTTLPTKKSSLALTYNGRKPEAVMITKNENNKYNMIGGIINKSVGKPGGIVNKIGKGSSFLNNSSINKVRKIQIRGKSRIGVDARKKQSYMLPNIFN